METDQLPGFSQVSQVVTQADSLGCPGLHHRLQFGTLGCAGWQSVGLLFGGCWMVAWLAGWQAGWQAVDGG